LIGTLIRRIFGRGPKLLAVGTLAPAFEVRDHTGVVRRLADYRGKRVILWFYPKASTSVCTKQGCGFRDQSPALEALGVAVLGVSFDDAERNRAFATAQRFSFPLLCDVDRKIGLAYGACETARDAFPRRITYVIGADGKIEQAIETKDAGGQAAELMRGF
jgi:peroxiredoxin Q/BCP